MIWFLGFVALLSAKTFAATVLNLAECDGTTNNVCDGTKGLYCDKLWKGCLIGVCKCNTDTAWETDKCKTVVAYGGDCTDTATKVCESLTTCTAGKCACATSTTYNAVYSGKCLADGTKKVGETCTADTGCESGSCDTVALPNVCKCPAGKVEKSGFCYPPIVGETCVVANNDCLGTNVECIAGTTKCTCTTGNIAWTTASKGCKVDGAGAEGDVCVNDDACDGNLMQCTACGAGSADPIKYCRLAYVKSSGSTIVTGPFAVLMIGITLFSIYF